MKGKIVEDKNTRPSYKEDNLDYDMAFSKSLREKVFLSKYIYLFFYAPEKKLYLQRCKKKYYLL